MGQPSNLHVLETMSQEYTDDAAPAFAIKHVGRVGDQSTVATADWDPSVDINIANAGKLTYQHDTGTTGDALIGTAGVVDITNGQLLSAHMTVIDAAVNWDISSLGMLPTDAIDTAATLNVLDVTAATANGRACESGENGTIFYNDVSASLLVGVCIGPEGRITGNPAAYGNFTGRKSYRTVQGANRDTAAEKGDPAIVRQSMDLVCFCTEIVAQATFAGAGLPTITIYAVDKDGNVRTIVTYNGAATTVDKTIDLTAAWVVTRRGEKMVVQIKKSDLTAGTIRVNGGWGFKTN